MGPPAPAGSPESLWLSPFLVRAHRKEPASVHLSGSGGRQEPFRAAQCSDKGPGIPAKISSLLNHGSLQPSLLSPKPENQNTHKVVLAGRGEGGNRSWGGPASVGSRLQVGRDGGRAGRPRTAHWGCSLRAKKHRGRGAQRGDKGDRGRGTDGGCRLPARAASVRSELAGGNTNVRAHLHVKLGTGLLPPAELEFFRCHEKATVFSSLLRFLYY